MTDYYNVFNFSYLVFTIRNTKIASAEAEFSINILNFFQRESHKKTDENCLVWIIVKKMGFRHFSDEKKIFFSGNQTPSIKANSQIKNH